MVSRVHSWLRIGIIAAALGCGMSVASAQGDGRYGGDRRGGNPTCGNELWCGNSARTFRRPSWDGPGRRVDRIRPRQYRNERPIRPNYRPYRPRYYDYDGGSDIYLDFSGPSYRSYEPIYPRRYYRRSEMSFAHIQWCYERYRTYRESDNTYVRRRGVRAQCYSPYS